jgi:hypothetical protein
MASPPFPTVGDRAQLAESFDIEAQIDREPSSYQWGVGIPGTLADPDSRRWVAANVVP